MARILTVCAISTALRQRDQAQTLVEYGLLVTLLAMAAAVILGATGQDVVGLFTSVATAFENASTP